MIYRLVAMCLIACLLASGALAQKRVALIIGNNDYSNSDPLRNAVNDAKDISEALNGIGFELITGGPLLNADRDDTLDAINTFRDSIQAGDIALFYFSGHGAQYDGRNYLVPVNDTRIQYREDLEDYAVSLGTVSKRVQSKKGVVLISILDACRNNALPSRVGDRSVARGFAPIEVKGNQAYVAFATAPGTTASDGDGDNGVFTAVILEEFGNPDRRVIDIFNDVRRKVRENTGEAQIPWSTSSLEYPLYLSGRSPDQTRQPDPEEQKFLAVKDCATIKEFMTAYPDGRYSVMASQLVMQFCGAPSLDLDEAIAEASTDATVAEIDFGADSSNWANDGECDDPRFSGDGMTSTLLLDSDAFADASDCRSAYEAGGLVFNASWEPGANAGTEGPALDPSAASEPLFGDDTSRWANDGECDDPRFEGDGMTGTMLLEVDMFRDASDCQAAWQAGQIVLKMTPANAP